MQLSSFWARRALEIVSAEFHLHFPRSHNYFVTEPGWNAHQVKFLVVLDWWFLGRDEHRAWTPSEYPSSLMSQFLWRPRSQNPQPHLQPPELMFLPSQQLQMCVTYFSFSCMLVHIHIFPQTHVSYFPGLSFLTFLDLNHLRTSCGSAHLLHASSEKYFLSTYQGCRITRPTCPPGACGPKHTSTSYRLSLSSAHNSPTT